MSNNINPNNKEIIKGILLLALFHVVAILLVFFVISILLTYILGDGCAPGTGCGVILLLFWVRGASGFFLWQLLYVLPLIIWLKRRGNTGMMKGVIVGAVITALLSGTCSLSFFLN